MNPLPGKKPTVEASSAAIERRKILRLYEAAGPQSIGLWSRMPAFGLVVPGISPSL